MQSSIPPPATATRSPSEEAVLRSGKTDKKTNWNSIVLNAFLPKKGKAQSGGTVLQDSRFTLGTIYDGNVEVVSGQTPQYLSDMCDPRISNGQKDLVCLIFKE